MKKCFQISAVIIGIIAVTIACTKQNDISNSTKFNSINAFSTLSAESRMHKKDSIPHKKDSLPPKRDSLPPVIDSIPKHDSIPPVIDSFPHPKDSVPHFPKPKH